MPRRAVNAALLPLALDRVGEKPMHRQLYDQLRELILTGRVSSGERLPSTRTLSRDLSVSRNTIATAFDQLLAEGYLEGRVGAGSYVSRELPEETLSARSEATCAPESHPRKRGLSARGKALAALRRKRGKQTPTFTPGLPDVDDFPFDVWSRLMSRA